MDTKLQVMETWGTIEPKQYVLGMISLVHNVTHRLNETFKAMLDMFGVKKYLMLCHQKEHISLTQYLAELKGRTEVVTGAVVNPGHHTASVILVVSEQVLEVDSLALK